MKNSILIILLLVGLRSFGQSGEEQKINDLLIEFLSKVDQKEMHDRFWADELIYTGSSGRRIGKADIMAGFDGESNDGGPTTTYSAEEVQIKVKDHLAILAFRLVAKTDTNGEVKTAHYYNSGTLENQGGEWKVILWQATKIPDTE